MFKRPRQAVMQAQRQKSWSTTAHARPATMMLINLFSRLFLSSKQFGVEGSGHISPVSVHWSQADEQLSSVKIHITHFVEYSRKAQGDFWPTLGKTSRLISAASISLSILPLNYF
ncbi:putative toxin-antitoxin system protein [Trichinella spiralis]|uniref:putative toxin-antitoxin system protein n=1 Tax=Trichinella spiralis TaxID=6334 RepID=UPI0001EFD08E|nr:putative toxin-antitoxin system protein [Trichinella spiralis]